MNRKLKRATNHWLEQEKSGRSEEAEQALQKVFSRLPAEPVPIGFAERVLQQVGFGPTASAARSWAAFWGVRAAVSLCLILVALFLLIIPSYLPALLGIFNPNRMAEVGISALVGVSHQLGSGLVVWRALSKAGSIATTTLSSPQYLTALVLGLLLSIGALRALHEVIIAERSSRYVRSA